MGLNPIDWIEDGVDYVEDTISDFIDDPFGTIGQVAGEAFRGFLGLATLGATNKYDTGYWIEKFTPEQNPVFQDRNVTIRNSLATREIVYGRVRKGGTLVYAGTSGADDRFINLIIVLASHACESVNDVYFDDTLVATKLGTDVQDTQTFSIATDYQGKLALFSQLGNHTEQYSIITAATPDDWTTDHKLLGCTLLYVQMRYDKKLYRRGIPNITVVMDGKNDIYDPRGGGSIGYTNNHALVCLDYIRTKDGLRVPDSEILMQTFIEGAEYCDDQVEGLPGIYLEDRYTANGVIKIENRPLDTLEEMQKAAGAFVTTSQGLWSYIRSEYIAPVASFDESDIISDIQFSPSGSKEGRFNTVTGVFIAPSANWKASDYPAVTYPGYVAADGEELSTTIDFNFVTSPYQAQRLAKLAIERSRYGMTLTGTFKLKAVELQAGDRVFLSITSLGISNAIFLVLDTGISFDGGVALVLRQDAAEIYTDSASDRTEFTPATLLNLPDPNPIVPTGVAISEELYSTNGGRNIKARAVVSWVEPDGRTQNYDVQFKPSADSNWRNVETSVFGTEARKDDLAVDTYDFRVRAINQLGWESDWSATVQHAFLGKTAPPPDIDSVSAEDELVSWDYSSAPLDLDGFEVRIHLGINSDWTTASPMHDGLVSDSKFDVRDALIATSTILVKAKDTSGIYSVNAVSIAVSPSASGDNVNWSDVIDDDGNRPADGADVTDYDDDRVNNNVATPFTLIPTPQCRVDGAKITCLVDNNKTEGVYSQESIVGGAFVSFKIPATDKGCWVGMESSPISDPIIYPIDYSINPIDYSISTFGDGNFHVRQYGMNAGTDEGEFEIPLTAGDTFYIAYDGTSVRYHHNGRLIRTVGAAPGLRFHFNGSFDDAGAGVEAIQFGPYGSNDWNQMGGSNKPADNATEGASWGDNISGQPSTDVLYNNLLDTSSWATTAPNGSIEGFSSLGGAAYNKHEIGVGPAGTNEIVWAGSNGNQSLVNTGFITDPVTIEPGKLYRMSAWIRKTGNAADLRVVYGVDPNNDIEEVSGSYNSTFGYVGDATLSQADKWYLAVWFVFPYGYVAGSGVEGKNGLYDPATGDIDPATASASDVRFSSPTANQLSLLFGSRSVYQNGYSRIVRPRIDIVNGSEQSIQSLLS